MHLESLQLLLNYTLLAIQIQRLKELRRTNTKGYKLNNPSHAEVSMSQGIGPFTTLPYPFYYHADKSDISFVAELQIHQSVIKTCSE